MKTSIIQIGNSKGLRLSKTVLKKYNITDAVEMILEEGQIVLKPIHDPRSHWDEAFAKMRENSDDRFLFNDVFDDEDFEEWS